MSVTTKNSGPAARAEPTAGRRRVELLRVKEVAARLRVSDETVRRMIARGELRSVIVSVSPASRKPRRCVPSDELESFLLRRSGASETKPARRPRRTEEEFQYVQ